MDDGGAEDGELANWRIGGPADRRIGGSADRRTGGSADRRTGGSADRRTGDIGSDIASARPALALTRVKR
ncbi:hypothetical protein J6337_14785 [Burkholderia pseudomallei]|uniref:hypothetical protein n=1 Tax=Burkholderia pseudomallei TaxID=28450 RepID=UPI001AD77880|nr:hypothetical protein [Burkholderia pseudomallei]MBO7864265.1 hypothetical protein [Burkholderia pseudomallei]MBO7876768.1 hypothetical protein [Burkholderia pseudomallei]